MGIVDERDGADNTIERSFHGVEIVPRFGVLRKESGVHHPVVDAASNRERCLGARALKSDACAVFMLIVEQNDPLFGAALSNRAAVLECVPRHVDSAFDPQTYNFLVLKYSVPSRHGSSQVLWLKADAKARRMALRRPAMSAMKAIDTHAHILSEETMRLIGKEAPQVAPKLTPIDDDFAVLEIAGAPYRPFPRGGWDMERRLKDMDFSDVDVQVLSNTPQTFLYNQDASLNATLSALQNDQI